MSKFVCVKSDVGFCHVLPSIFESSPSSDGFVFSVVDNGSCGLSIVMGDHYSIGESDNDDDYTAWAANIDFNYEDDPREIAKQLRELADWLESQ